MALNTEKKVPMPEHGVARKKVAGKTYIYYATATYRNAKGQPTCDRVSIGKLDEESGMLIPNRNYYEIYKQEPAPQTTAIHDFGVGYAFEEIAKKLGLEKLLKSYCPEHYKEILTIAQYMLSEGNVMYYLDDYTETHVSSLKEVLSDCKASKVFAELRPEDRMLFFREWLKNKKPKEYVAYDVTSFSSYSKQMEGLEWGYNRDKERMPQLNMGMYYGEESGLPLYYRVYPGSISDKAHLKYMVEDNEFINAKKTRFVMDRGFYSAENLKFLTDRAYRFVMTLPMSLKYCKKLIHDNREKIINHSEYMLGAGLPYGKSVDVNELGFRMRVHLYYDPSKAAQESATFYELLERQENDLRLMDEPPERKLKYDKYFYINRSKDGKLGFIRNHKAIDEKLETLGFFLIAETDFSKNSAEILHVYRNRDMVEKSFDNLKNELDMKRLRCHNAQTMQGKVFVSFIALVVRTYMLNHLKQYMHVSGSTLQKVLLELDKIKCLDLNEKHKPRLLNPPTKTQRDIFDALQLSPPA